MSDAEQPVRRRLPVVIRIGLVFALVGVCGVLVNWGVHRANHVSTDDAQVAADMIDIRSKTSGIISALPVGQGQTLKRGELIAQLDDREESLHLQELESQVAAKEANIGRAEAELQMVTAQISSSVEAVASKLHGAEARLKAARAEKEFEASEWARAQSLRERKIISER